MKPLATFKHISSKNADYGAAEQYLTFEHDEFTMKPTLDENGRLVPREDYRLATLNCGDEDFAIACMRSNLRYGKNQKREDVKSHHYIISFDPRDGTDNGLTVDKAQSLGEEFCKEQFPGHQAIGEICNKYFATHETVSTEDRQKVLRFLENICLGAAAVGYRTESLHGVGSPQAQRIMIARQGNIRGKKQLAKNIAGIE